MPVYSFPDTYSEEVTALDGPIQSTALGIGGLQAVTERGPVAVPIRTRSFSSWKRIFGGYVSYSDAAYEAKAFFDEGGFELVTIRQAHFSSLADKSTFTGVAAAKMALSGTVAATSASKTSSVGPFNLVTSGKTIVLDVDNAGDATSTFTGVNGYVIDTTSYPVADQNGKNIVITLNNGGAQTITFSGTTTTLDDIVEQINNQLKYGYATESTGQLKIVSDTMGTDSTVAAAVGTSNLTFGSPVAGTGNVGDITAITSDEVKTIVELATTANVTSNSDGSFTIVSPTTGASSELDFDGTSTGLTPFGLTVQVIVGVAAGPAQNTLKVEAGYKGYKSPGSYGNTLGITITRNPLHPTASPSADLSAAISGTATTIAVTNPKGIQADSILKITDGVNTEFKVVQKIETTVAGGVVTHTVTLTSAITNSYLVAATTVTSMEFDLSVYENGSLVETWTGLSMLDTADNYVETIINDENTGSSYIYVTDQDAAAGVGWDTPATLAYTLLNTTTGTDDYSTIVDTDWIGSSTGGTGLYAWDSVNEFMPFALCKLSTTQFSAAVFHSAALYAKGRLWFDFVEAVPVGMTATNAIAYRNSTLGISSSYAFLYAGGIEVADANGSGSNPKKSIKGVGAIMGVMSRVDTLPVPNGGPWQSPAGEGDYGQIISALDVADAYTKEDCGLLNDAHVNVIVKFTKTSPVTIWGARTLDASATQEFRYINTRRTFQYFEKAVVDGTRWAVFRNNDYKLWGRLKDRITEFLLDKMGEGAFPTSDKAKAFYVLVGINDGVMDSADRDAGKVIGKIGLAPHKPGEFIIFQFAQYSAGLEVSEV